MSIDEAARVAESSSSEEELRARVVDLEVLYGLAEAIGRAATLEQTLDDALDPLCVALGLERVAVLLPDEAGVMRFVAWRGLSDEYRALVAGHSPWAADETDPAPVLIADVDEEPSLAALRRQIVDEGIRALAFVPLVHQGRLLGRFMLYRSEPGPWRDRDIRLTQALAMHIAAAAERHRAIAALEGSHLRLAVVLRDVADAITVQAPDGHLVYANDAAALTLGYDSAKALLAASPAELINAFEFFDEERRPLPLAELPGRLALTGVATPERLVLSRVRATGEEHWWLIRARPILAADGSVEAAVNVLHDVTDRRRREEAVRFVADAGVILTSSLDVETTLASVARLAVPRIADWCIVYMREEDGNIRRLAIEHAGGDAEAVGEVLDRYPLDVEAEVGVPYVVRTGQTLLLADVSAHGLMADVVDPEALAAELKHIALASYLCVPLIARGRTLGAISLLSSESGRRFDLAEKELAEQLADRAALAVDNARLYRDAEQAAASERRRSEQLLRLSQAALLVNAAGDLDELLALLTARAREIVGAARAVTTIGDVGEGEATVRAVAGIGTPPPDGSVLTAPLVARDGRMLGAIELVGGEDHPFTAEDEAILVQLAQMASVAVENFRAEAERERLVAELRSQGALLEAVLRQLPSGVIIAGPDGGVVMSNDQAAEIFQERFEVASFSRADAYAGYHPEGRQYETGEWPLARAVERGESVVGETIEIKRADGSQRVIEVSAAPVRAGGEVIAGVTTFSDVTDRARAEQRLRFLAEASTVLGSSLEYEQTLVAVSELAVPMLADWCSISVLEDDNTVKVVSWTHSDPERRGWADELRKRRQVRLDDATPTAEVIRSGKPVLVRKITDEIVARYRPEDAELARAMGVRSFVVVPFTSGAGTLGSIMLVSAESGREFDDDDVLLARELGRRAGAAIENARLYQAMEQRARAAEALEFVGEGVLLVGGDGFVRIWNPQAEAITGLAVRDVEGRPAADAIPGWEKLTQRVPVVDAGDALRSRSQVVQFEVEGAELWLAMSGVRFPDGTVYAFRDITEERGLERMKSDFVSTVSHELRTPLAAIYGAALTLRRADMPLPDDQRQELLGVIADEADRLARIVNDILWTSRIESGAMQVQIESCDASDLATTVVQAARLHLPAGVALDLTGATDLLRVAADPDKVRQVLANLVDNAVKYSPGGGRVEVALERHDGSVHFAVSDEGLGIPTGSASASSRSSTASTRT